MSLQTLNTKMQSLDTKKRSPRMGNILDIEWKKKAEEKKSLYFKKRLNARLHCQNPIFYGVCHQWELKSTFQLVTLAFIGTCRYRL
jgi:hypothetical protein